MGRMFSSLDSEHLCKMHAKLLNDVHFPYVVFAREIKLKNESCDVIKRLFAVFHIADNLITSVNVI